MRAVSRLQVLPPPGSSREDSLVDGRFLIVPGVTERRARLARGFTTVEATLDTCPTRPDQLRGALLTPVVLKCGETPVPLALTPVTAVSAPALPEKDDFESVFANLEAVEDPRLIVVGGDAAFAATLTRLMRTDRLAVELAYVPEKRTPATEAYGLRTGSKAAAEALQGTARSIPLIRDDAGIALVGRALVEGDGPDLVGEAYVDDTRLFSGSVPGLRIEPTPTLPGLRAAVDRPRWFGGYRWLEGRAVQLGSPGALLTRDGVANSRAVKRSTFYRHDQDWLLVR